MPLIVLTLHNLVKIQAVYKRFQKTQRNSCIEVPDISAFSSGSRVLISSDGTSKALFQTSSKLCT
ncbi:MAG: hypothetical protein RJA66_179, partial [Actinomycetota bacterium]